MGVATNPNPLASMGIIDPRLYGAVSDGTTDCTAALNAAMLAATPGQTIYFPPGQWLFTGNVTCRPDVSLFGGGRGLSGLDIQVWTLGQPAQTAQGTTFLITGGSGTSSASATPFLTPASGTTIEGIIFRYPNQGIASLGTIVAYPYTIGTPYAAPLDQLKTVSAYGVTIRNCTFANSYQAIRLWSAWPVTIEDCTISAVITGIWVDHCYDTSVVRRVMVVPWGFHDGVSDPPLPILQNLIAYRFSRCDSVILADSMVFLAAKGVLLDASSVGTPGAGSPWFLMSNGVLDFCSIGIDVQSLPIHGARVNNTTITTPYVPYGAFTDPNGIAVRLGSGSGSNGGTFTIANSCITSCLGHEVNVAGGSFRAIGCNFNSLSQSTAGSNTSVVVTGGKAAIVGCEFTEARPQMAFSGGGKAIFANNITGSGGVSVTGVTSSNCV